MTDQTSETNLLELATELTVAWLSNPNTNVPADELPAVLQKIHGALTSLSPAAAEAAASQAEHAPAVSVRRSLASRDHIVSMIDGKPYKMLRRHLATHGLTPEQYRERYGLKHDYPMVAANYAEKRRDLAKKIGLGRKPGGRPAAPQSRRQAKANGARTEAQA
jgi:predicted transcriptional regulator